MAVVIAIDAGTTGVRAIAFDERGLPTGVRRTGSSRSTSPGPVGWSTTPTRSGTPSPTCSARWAPPHETPGRPSPASASPTSARPSWSGTGARAGPCTGPSSGRTVAPRPAATSCGTPGTSPWCASTTGLVLDPYFSGTKLEWLFTEGGVRPGPDVAVGTVDAWLIWKLTGGAVHATDATNASRTMLFDIRRGTLVAGAVRPPRGARRGAADGRRLERAHRRHRGGLTARCRRRRSAAWPGTSRRRCSARPASHRA